MQREVDLLQAVGNVIGVALENARLFQETERRNQELQSLYSVASSVTQSLDIATLTQSVLETIIDVLRVDAGRLYVLDEKSQILRLAAHHGIPVDRVSSIENYAPGEGIIGKIFSESKPILLPDISTDPSYKSIARSEMGRHLGFRSAAGLPITLRGRPIGVIYVYARKPRDFTPGEMGLFSTIGGQIGVALENARLFEKTQRDLRRIQALREIDQAITSTMDLRGRLKILLEKIELFFPYPNAAVVRLVNKKNGALEFLACCNMDEATWKKRLSGHSGLRAKRVVETKKTVVVRKGGLVRRNRDFYLKEGLVSYIALPLIVKDEVIGVLSLYTKEEHDFTQEEIESLETLVGQAAIAIHEAKLYEETERRRREAEELARVAQFLAENLDMTAVGERIVASVRDLFTVRHATLRLLHADGSLHAIASSGEVFSESFRGDTVLPGKGVASRAIAEGKTIWSPDTLNDPEIHLTDRMREYQLRTGNSAMMAAPLRVHEKVIGALLLSDQTGRTYSEDEVALLQTFADQAALALENARLFDEVRQKIVELQQKTSELEKANKAKDEFLSIMSHELRTPLNVVIGYSAMLKEGMLGKVNTEQEDALNKILGRADDQLQMINTILQATQIGAGAVAVTKQAVNLTELLDEIRSSYDLPIHKEITLRWEPASELPIVWTDSDKVKHILQNIIGNAIKFTEKGSITVAVRYIAQPGAIEFKVADTGIGIPPAMLPTIFDKFRQVDSSERREFEGVGLGLYIVKQFTEVLGGKVEVESEEGKGSTFIVTLPAEMPPDKSTRAADMIESGYLI